MSRLGRHSVFVVMYNECNNIKTRRKRTSCYLRAQQACFLFLPSYRRSFINFCLPLFSKEWRKITHFHGGDRAAASQIGCVFLLFHPKKCLLLGTGINETANTLGRRHTGDAMFYVLIFYGYYHFVETIAKV